MRPQKINDIELLNGLMTVLRSKGYDGASLNELASASGLQKASLYHRYPGGKKEITLAVLSFVGEWIEKNIVAVVNNLTIPPSQRLLVALENINILYDSGQSSCLLRALSTDNGMSLFGEKIKNGTVEWLKGFTKLGLDFGFDQQTAEETAMQAFINIQGSLVASKTLNDTSPFKTALAKIKASYIKD